MSLLGKRFMVLAFLLVLLSAFPAAAQKPEFLPTLKISTPEGDMYVALTGESDGPVRIPLKDNPFTTALELSPVLEEEGSVRLAVFSVVDELTIEPVNVYQLTLPETITKERSIFGSLKALSSAEGEVGEPVRLYEIERLGLEGWSVSLAGFKPAVTKGGGCECCSCGGLYCCANTGKCIGCGSCGDCCCTGGGGIPKRGE